jgi:hypothetical protein
MKRAAALFLTVLTLPAFAQDAAVVDPEQHGERALAQTPDSSRFLVVRARVLSRVVTQIPEGKPDAGGIVVKMLTCGEESLHLEVLEVLWGDYPDKEIAATMGMSQWCSSMIQASVDQYVLVLEWEFPAWRTWQSLSSPLVSHDGKQWFVEPYSILNWSRRGLTPAMKVAIPESTRVAMSIERTRSLGEDIAPEQVRKDAAECRYGECWYLAPMQYTQGFDLEEFTRLLREHPPRQEPSE